jgi:hypothetical protein
MFGPLWPAPPAFIAISPEAKYFWWFSSKMLLILWKDHMIASDLVIIRNYDI